MLVWMNLFYPLKDPQENHYLWWRPPLDLLLLKKIHKIRLLCRSWLWNLDTKKCSIGDDGMHDPEVGEISDILILTMCKLDMAQAGTRKNNTTKPQLLISMKPLNRSKVIRNFDSSQANIAFHIFDPSAIITFNIDFSFLISIFTISDSGLNYWPVHLTKPRTKKKKTMFSSKQRRLNSCEEIMALGPYFSISDPG